MYKLGVGFIRILNKDGIFGTKIYVSCLHVYNYFFIN